MITNNERNYNTETEDNPERKYAYNFDFDIMHPFMIRAFTPFFRDGNILELGSFESAFTKRLCQSFDDITCVEASASAIEKAQNVINDKVKIINARFEDAVLPNVYNNVVMSHVLEHCDDPVQVLKRINLEWLAPGGRLLLACPNANAPSRQIAVKMGLISHNDAVTEGEALHGHHRTYTLDTLSQDAEAAELRIIHRSGIFFKALANFQWDQVITQKIVSNEYLDGCYELGLEHPDLCASIYLVCEAG